MEMKEILTLIEKVSQSSLRVFSLKQNKDGIQIEMKKEEMSTVHSLADMAEVRGVQDGYCTGDGIFGPDGRYFQMQRGRTDAASHRKRAE